MEPVPAPVTAATEPASTLRAVIVSGSGRYSDPWHPFSRTSAALAELLADGGFAVSVEDDLDAAMTRLDDVSLLVVNAGDPWRNAAVAPTPAESISGFQHAVRRGIGILAMHTAAATMRGYPDWAPTIGAVWLPGISHHPPAAEIHVTMCDPRFVDGDSIRIFDERYCDLQPVGRSRVVATHTAEGTTHPAVWLRTVDRSRVAVDLFGHDERSYDSGGHRALITALARWATGQIAD